jgi:hypothetical protein
MKLISLGAVLIGCAATAPACEPPVHGANVLKIEGARYVLAWRPIPAPIRAGEFVTLEVGVCARDGQPRPATLRVDATMPEHKHGMNYRPSVTPKGTDRFAADGVMLHMAGHWEIVFDINIGAAQESLRTSVEIQ